MKCLYDVLPSSTNCCRLMMVEHIPFFPKNFKGLIPPHQYTSEMSEKSEVPCKMSHHNFYMHTQVLLGILPKNETK